MKIFLDIKKLFEKEQIKDAIAYLLFNYYFSVCPKIFCQIIGFPIGSDSALFL